MLSLDRQQLQPESSVLPERNLVTELQGATIKQIYTPVWLHTISQEDRTKGILGNNKPDYTLGTVPDRVWDDIASKYNGIYFLTVFKRGEMGREHAMLYQDQYTYTAPKDYNPQKDVISSGFPHLGYDHIDPILAPGDWKEFDTVIQKKLHARNIKVGVDFVGHIVAMDHPLVGQDKDFFITGNEQQVAANPKGYSKKVFYDQNKEPYWIAYGNDQHYDSMPWTDSAKVNLASPRVQEAVAREAADLVANHQIDFLRLDMAHLATRDIFPKTCPAPLGETDRRSLARQELWDIFPDTVKAAAHSRGRGVALIAEAYDHEDHLLSKGIDFVYGHEDFYRLEKEISHGTKNVEDLENDLKFNPRARREIHYQENHDEPRAASADGLGNWERARAFAAVSAFRKNGVWMTYDGQENGEKIRPIMQLRRARNDQSADSAYFDRLLHMRQSQLFRLGKGSTPEHFSSGDDSYKRIVVQQVENNSEGAIMCVNLSGEKAAAKIRIPENAGNIYLVDMNSGYKRLIPNLPVLEEGDLDCLHLPIGIESWQALLVMYEKVSSLSI